MGLMVLGGDPDYKNLTLLEAEMRICAEYLHCKHSEFKNLSKDERLKWMLYLEMQSRRIEFEDEERKKEAALLKAKQKINVRGPRKERAVKELY